MGKSQPPIPCQESSNMDWVLGNKEGRTDVELSTSQYLNHLWLVVTTVPIWFHFPIQELGTES